MAVLIAVELAPFLLANLTGKGLRSAQQPISTCQLSDTYVTRVASLAPIRSRIAALKVAASAA